MTRPIIIYWGPSVTTTSEPYPPELVVGVTSDRISNVSPAARSLHRAILHAFASTGQAPDPQTLTPPEPGDLATLISELHEQDVIRLDGDGRIQAAYPFSGVPTAHTVAIEDGPTVFSMCAIDALGMSSMLGRPTTITSADPISGEQIHVRVRDGQATWEPATAVAYVGASQPGAGGCTDGDASDDGCSGGAATAAADRCCGVMNFFASQESARQWITAHPQSSGRILDQNQALRLGVDIFGDLL